MKVFKNLPNQQLISSLDDCVRSERKIAAIVLEYICEIMRRELFHEYGHSNIYDFLTKRSGYSSGAAQRRIDAARLLAEFPELKQDLISGDLSLSQVSQVAFEVRRAERVKQTKIPSHKKWELLTKVRNKNAPEAALILAQALDLPLLERERTQIQKNESLRLEFTLTKEQRILLERVKEVISHRHPNPTWAELFAYLGEEFLKKRDPRRASSVRKVTAVTEVTPQQKRTGSKKRKGIPAALQREIHQKYQSCQWPISAGKTCGSRFRLQIDHRRPVWVGGGNEPQNLQVLCSLHNSSKYRLENTDFSPPSRRGNPS